MPWWSWIVIWIALVALSLAYLLLLGIRVWRGFSATLKSFEDAGDRLGGYQRQKAAEYEALSVERTGPPPGSAVFASPVQMKDDYTAAKAARVAERRRRRIARRAERGQPQSLRDMDLA